MTEPKYLCPVAGSTSTDFFSAKPENCGLDLEVLWKVKEGTFSRLDDVIHDPRTGRIRKDLPLRTLYEMYFIRWLIYGELGYEVAGPDSMSAIEGKFSRIFRHNDEVNLECSKYFVDGKPTSDPDNYAWFKCKKDPKAEDNLRNYPDQYFRINYWKAKVAMILANEIDLPASRATLRKPVFGLTIPAGDAPLSNDQKVTLLREVYEKLIRQHRNAFGKTDPLLEVDCLLAQHFYATGSVQPSKDLAYVRGLIDGIIADTKAMADAKAAGETNLHGTSPDRVPPYIRGRSNAVVLDGTSIDRLIGDTFGYRAEAFKMKAQLIMLQTKNDDPQYSIKIEEALDLLQQAQNLVNDYVVRDGYSVKKDEEKVYSNLIALFNIELLKANALYMLALNASLTDPAIAATRFDQASAMAENAARMLESIQVDFENRIAQVDAGGRQLHPQIAGRVLWRTNIYTELQFLRADIELSRNGGDLAKAQTILNGLAGHSESLSKQNQIRLRLMRADIPLRQAPANPTAALQILAPLFDAAYNPTTDSDGSRALAIVKAAGFDQSRPMAGAIRLTQAKTLLTYAYVTKDRTVFPAVVSTLNDLITEAAKPGSRLLEPYQLSTAYQVRADAFVAQDRFNDARNDYQQAVDVFRAADGTPLNYFAVLGLADIDNWQLRYDQALPAYDKVIADPRTSTEIKLRARLGSAEAALRRDYAQLDGDREALARAVVTVSEEIVKADPPMPEYLATRARDSLREARLAIIDGCITKKAAGLDSLRTLVAEITPLPEDETKLVSLLRLIDGFIFTSQYETASELLAKVDPAKLAAVPAEAARYHLAKAELVLYQSDETVNPAALSELQSAAQRLFSLPPEKIDPYLASRVVRDLVLYYSKTKQYGQALAVITAASGGADPANFLQGKKPSEVMSPKLWAQLSFELKISAAEVYMIQKQYQLAADILKPLKPEDYPPEQRVLLLYQRASLFRYGDDFKDLDQAVLEYQALEEAAKLIAGDEELKQHSLARVRIGLAFIALEKRSVTLSGESYSPREMLALIEPFRSSVTTAWRKKEIEEQLEILSRSQGDNSYVRLSASGFSDNSGNNEFRLSLDLRYPFPISGTDLTLTPLAQITSDLEGAAALNSYYLGGRIDYAPWLGVEVTARLGSHLINSELMSLRYQRRPDVSLSARLSGQALEIPVLQDLSAATRIDLSFSHPEMDTYYVGLEYDAAEALTGLAVGLEFTRYQFPYRGFFFDRNRLSVTARYEHNLPYDLLATFQLSPLVEAGSNPSYYGVDHVANLGLITRAGLAWAVNGYLRLQATVGDELIVEDIGARNYPANLVNFALGAGATW